MGSRTGKNEKTSGSAENFFGETSIIDPNKISETYPQIPQEKPPLKGFGHGWDEISEPNDSGPSQDGQHLGMGR